MLSARVKNPLPGPISSVYVPAANRLHACSLAWGYRSQVRHIDARKVKLADLFLESHPAEKIFYPPVDRLIGIEICDSTSVVDCERTNTDPATIGSAARMNTGKGLSKRIEASHSFVLFTRGDQGLQIESLAIRPTATTEAAGPNTFLPHPD